MVGEWWQTLSYPSLGVPVAESDVEGQGDEHGEEDAPFDDDARLFRMFSCQYTCRALQ